MLTSALDDEVAMDGGPIAGHSLFTGCLIEALGGELFAKLRRPIAAASEIWSHVRDRVFSFSSQKQWKQTPEFGRLDFDDHGELVVQLRGPAFEPSERSQSTPAAGCDAREANHGTRAAEESPVREPMLRPRRTARPPPQHDRADDPGALALNPGRSASASIAPVNVQPRSEPGKAGTLPGPDRPMPEGSGPELAAAFAALDRHDAERRRGASVLSIVTGDAPTTLTAWAAWAARRGCLTLVTESASLDDVITDLLAQAPWLRSMQAARERLAAAAHLQPDEIDAALDARSEAERAAWIEEVADMDRHARVSGWLLSSLRERCARVLDPTAAPVQDGALLAVLCDLAAPIAVLLHRPEPARPWLEAAIRTAAALVAYMPRHSVAVGAPSSLVTDVLRGRDSAALSMARQGMVPIASSAWPATGRPRSGTERTLYEALARDPRTAGRFALHVAVHTAAGKVEVDLLAQVARLVVEIDGWYHFREPQGYRRDRAKDVLLQRAGFFVMRFLAEDIEDRIASIIDEIATGLSGRRAASPL
ncbi:MAG: DUF559 domain-containing protein [Deltaproteobacteria bacterium]|nr:MAG: DUF559 domain-containing protein [Deltaproteobacteria bacterium]